MKAPRLEILHTNSPDEALRATREGWCPVECSFGDISIVDDLKMDHHGPWSYLESVALRAWRDHFRQREHAPRFVVTGAADADATFAIAALANLLPPGQDLMPLATLIAQADGEPLPLGEHDGPEAELLLLWKQLASGFGDEAEFYAGVDRWRTLVRTVPRELLAAARAADVTRIQKAKFARVERFGKHVVLVESSVAAFDIWYSYFAPVIVAFVGQSQRITIGVRDRQTAISLFGKKGLLSVAPTLRPSGWGGRECVLGSPRGVKLTRVDAHCIAEELNRIVASPIGAP